METACQLTIEKPEKLTPGFYFELLKDTVKMIFYRMA